MEKLSFAMFSLCPNQELAPDLSTKGCFPKAWIRDENGFILLKDSGEDTVKKWT